ncbi:hypothetical protein [Jiella mangrovi]|uniref:Uncharacterized protein n=1 Tax=Jiella mangrovi TaxID=2821407 RepID=A0ABS4BBT5_9HYPH|nr:hypothetical protein [Jiella mangrovi]MBP0614191.1 hypothetical protein [Jiella mangrovi]
MDGFWGGVVGGLVSGLLASAGAMWAYFHGYISIEKIERRRAKVSLVDDLIAYRFVLQDNFPVSELDAHAFNKALSRVPYVFSDEPEVMNAFDEFTSAPPPNGAKLITLLRTVTQSAGLKGGLQERYVSKAYSVLPYQRSL